MEPNKSKERIKGKSKKVFNFINKLNWRQTSNKFVSIIGQKEKNRMVSESEDEWKGKIAKSIEGKLIE